MESSSPPSRPPLWSSVNSSCGFIAADVYVATPPSSSNFRPQLCVNFAPLAAALSPRLENPYVLDSLHVYVDEAYCSMTCAHGDGRAILTCSSGGQILAQIGGEETALHTSLF
ncbi:hypothetical protein AAHA92_05723 [Salvia divinorum]|uniref:Uncharacterized protein n=1 Tax=Salvia divinorum TaxID=28513 RepID=A0ABD1I3B3_SALDI